jgi:hypothetical protein
VFDGVQHLEKSMITSTDRRNFIGGASASGLPRCLQCEGHNHRTAIVLVGSMSRVFPRRPASLRLPVSRCGRLPEALR